MADAKLETRVRREQIADAALQLVAAEGVKRLSIAAVARRVGQVPSGIYRHFKSKDQVLDAVLELLKTRLLANVELARAEADEPVEQIHRLMVNHVRFIRQGIAFPRIIFSDDVFAGHPERKAQVHSLVTAYLGAVEQLVRAGQQQGSIRKELVPKNVAVMFLGLIVPAGILWHLTEGGYNVTQHAARTWDMFRRAIVVSTP